MGRYYGGVYNVCKYSLNFREIESVVYDFVKRSLDMSYYVRTFARWLGIESEAGVTAMEYGLIASLVALAIIAGASGLGGKLGNTFNNIANNLN